MTAFDSREITIATPAGTAIQTKNDARVYNMALKVRRGTTPATAAWAQNDTWNVATLPAGATIIGFRISNGAFGSSVTLGLTANDGSARTLVTAFSVASAGNNFKPCEYSAQMATAVTVVATLAAADPTDDAQCTIDVLYVVVN